MAPKKRLRDEDITATTAAGGGPSTTMAFAGFFRALNVGGHNVIKMETLRKVMLSCGAVTCLTYIQSGNVVFELPRAMLVTASVARQALPSGPDDGVAAGAVATFQQAVVAELFSKHAVRTEMMVRSREALIEVLRRCPLAAPSQQPVPTALVPTFETCTAVDAKWLVCLFFGSNDACVPHSNQVVRDRFRVAGKLHGEILCVPRRLDGEHCARELFVYYPEGSGKSKLTVDTAQKVLGSTAPPTGRNWLTLVAMLGMLKAL